MIASLTSYNIDAALPFPIPIITRAHMQGTAKLRDKTRFIYFPDCKYKRKRGGVSHCYVRMADNISQVGAFARVANTNLSLSSLFVPHLAFLRRRIAGYCIGDRSRFHRICLEIESSNVWLLSGLITIRLVAARDEWEEVSHFSSSSPNEKLRLIRAPISRCLQSLCNTLFCPLYSSREYNCWTWKIYSLYYTLEFLMNTPLHNIWITNELSHNHVW